jgi:transcriptional regulator GlxA family with amidase domain
MAVNICPATVGGADRISAMATPFTQRRMTRRRAVACGAAALGLGTVAFVAGRPFARSPREEALSGTTTPVADTLALAPPTSGQIPVAVVVSERATVIDFAGPWEVFQDVPGYPFRLYTVSHSRDPIRCTAGLQVVPDYTFDDAPIPRVIVVGAQQAGTPAYGEWLQRMLGQVDVLMSVCTGAFILGKAGLLDGRAATTHHDFFEQFEAAFPNVELRRGLRYVEGETISTAGGLTSGIDLALRVVERYFGTDTAQRTAEYMEYQSDGWKAG